MNTSRKISMFSGKKLVQLAKEKDGKGLRKVLKQIKEQPQKPPKSEEERSDEHLKELGVTTTPVDNSEWMAAFSKKKKVD
ncbi:hypothetical protein KAI58_00875 [Candidatus Gracilibacteria bacterium]|nr:hypothetical protein [Candidatus Gracilibacteria bacterium]